MNVGYTKVSTDDQSVDWQRHALVEGGCEKIFEDQISGASPKCPNLDEAVALCGSDDVLVVWKPDRLGRSLCHLIMVFQKLADRALDVQQPQKGRAA